MLFSGGWRDESVGKNAGCPSKRLRSVPNTRMTANSS